MSDLFYTILKYGVIIIAITVHEFSHGFAAYLLGDDTAKRYRRLTLNPVAHIDRFGTIILPLLLLLVTRFQFTFGYAKPVPINPYNFQNFKRDTALTAAAGPVSNFILATIFGLLFRLLVVAPQFAGIGVLMQVCLFFVIFNLILGLFNLIPFPPLDGSKVLGLLLPDEIYYRFMSWERQGMLIFMALMVFSYIFKLNIIGQIIGGPLSWSVKLLTGIPF